MSITIQNLQTNKPVVLHLNSGGTLHLAPLQSSPELNQVEVKNNAMVQKLQEQQIIAVHQAQAKKSSSSGSKKRAAASKKKEARSAASTEEEK